MAVCPTRLFLILRLLLAPCGPILDYDRVLFIIALHEFPLAVGFWDVKRTRVDVIFVLFFPSKAVGTVDSSRCGWFFFLGACRWPLSITTLFVKPGIKIYLQCVSIPRRARLVRLHTFRW